MSDLPTTKPKKQYTFAVWYLRSFPGWLVPSHPLAKFFVGPLFLAASGVWVKADLSVFSVAAIVVAVLFQAFVSYIDAAKRDIDEGERQSARERFILFNQMAAGNVGAVLDTFWRRH